MSGPPDGTARRQGRTAVALALSLALAGVVPGGSLDGQEMRGTLSHTGFYAELRPLTLDSVGSSEVTPLSSSTWSYEGLPIDCRGELCTRYRAGSVESTVSGTLDGSFTAWGWGVRGLSTTVSFRLRGRAGGDMLWPRTDDRLDLFLGYAQYAAGRWRARLGRQRILAGLGRTAFDGASLVWVPRPGWRVEGYGGRSLARALAEPRYEALEGLEDFLPDQDVWLMGGRLQARPLDGLDLGLRYQREIFSDRSGLVSERASLDVRSYPWGRVRVDGSVDWDLGRQRVGKAELAARVPLDGARWTLEASASRYLPYFELWTVWGFFSPVPWNGVELRVDWAGEGETRAWVATAYRRYGETATQEVLSPLEDTGRRAVVGGSWAPTEALVLRGEYRVEWSAGAFYNGGDAGVRLRVSPEVTVSAHATAFQQIQEFRVGDGTVLGGGLSVNTDLPYSLRLSAGVSAMRSPERGSALRPDWTQLRGFWSLSVPLGDDPGLAERTP